MLTCYIIDNERHAIENLRSYIIKTPLLQLTGYHQNPLEALTYFQQNNQYPDITFLDIDMPQISGIELSAFLKGRTEIVFTTAHSSFALEAFELDIRDYLLKPYSYQRFLKCIHKINDSATQNKQKSTVDDFCYIQTESKGKLLKIYYKDINYVKSQKNYISIVTPEKKHLTYLTLSEIEEKLPVTFLRINKSFIVNTESIDRVEGSEIFLIKVQDSFPIGSSYKEAFHTYMKEHLLKTKRL